MDWILCRLYRMVTTVHVASHITHRCLTAHPVALLHILVFTLCLPVVLLPIRITRKPAFTSLSLYFPKHKSFMWQQFGPADTQWWMCPTPSLPPLASPWHPLRSHIYRTSPKAPAHQSCAVRTVSLRRSVSMKVEVEKRRYIWPDQPTYCPAHHYWHTLHFLHNLYNIFRNKWKCTKFSHSSFAICSSSWTFAGFFSPIADFSSPQRFSIRLGSGLIAGHLKTVNFSLFNHSCVLLDVCFGSLSCWRTHDLRLKPSFLTLGRTFRSKISW